MNNSRVVTHIIYGKSLTEIDNKLKESGIELTNNNIVSCAIHSHSPNMSAIITVWRPSKVVSPGNIEYQQYNNEL